jgi:Fe-S cluster biogenesis protein NfuA
VPRGTPQRERDHDDRSRDEEDLVPAALVREHARIVGAVSMRERVEETIEVIRPALQADGGDIVLREVDEATGVVKVTLVGACGTCPASDQTLKAGIERIMRDRIDGVTEVVAV